MRRSVGVVLIAVLSTVAFATAQSDERNAAVLLQKAQVMETIVGDVKGAIALYEKAGREAGVDRALAGQAALALALARQRIGDADARAAFQRVLRDFADQKDLASIARARLAAMGRSTRQSTELSARKVTDLETFGGQLSADGRYFLAGANRNLVLTDVTTGKSTRLIEGGPSGVPGMPVWSPDDKQFAYIWADGGSLATTRFAAALRVASIGAPATARTIVAAPPDVTQFFPIGWAADGASILVRALRPGATPPASLVWTFTWISLSDGSSRPLKAFDPGRTPYAVTLSPDGQFVAYTADVRDGERHIFVLNSRTGEEADVVKFAGGNNVPAWTPNGSHLVFVSDRSGSQALWAVPLQDGRAAGEPLFLQSVPGPMITAFPVRVASDGSLYYTLQVGGGPSTFITPLPSAPGAATTFVPGMSAAWAPDGRSVAFMRPNAAEFDVVVRSVDAGEERVYRRAGLSNVLPRWLPDGRSFLVVARDSAADERAFYTLNLQTGTFKRLFPVDPPDHARTAVGALAPDGTTLYLPARNKAAGAQWDRIVGIDLATGTENKTIALPANSLPGNTAPGIAVSPDGATLALLGWTDASMKTARLFTIGVDGTGFHEVYGGFPADGTPDKMRWSPDGRSLLFALLGPGGLQDRQIMRVPATGGEPKLEVNLADGSVLGATRVETLWSLDVNPTGSSLLIGALALPKSELWSMSNVLNLLSAK